MTSCGGNRAVGVGKEMGFTTEAIKFCLGDWRLGIASSMVLCWVDGLMGFQTEALDGGLDTKKTRFVRARSVGRRKLTRCVAAGLDVADAVWKREYRISSFSRAATVRWDEGIFVTRRHMTI